MRGTIPAPRPFWVVVISTSSPRAGTALSLCKRANLRRGDEARGNASAAKALFRATPQLPGSLRFAFPCGHTSHDSALRELALREDPGREQLDHYDASSAADRGVVQIKLRDQFRRGSHAEGWRERARPRRDGESPLFSSSTNLFVCAAPGRQCSATA